MYLIVGLGNPGREYQDNRHNIGFMVADELARRLSLGPMKSKFNGELALGEARGHRLAILKPMEFMNRSGRAVQAAAAFYQVEQPQIIVIHDELDLDFARVKVKSGGGHGGHNGLRSIHELLGPDYLRVRCGVGHPGHKDRVVGHVLSAFSKTEQKDVALLIDTAADAIESILSDGLITAMNRFNTEKPSKRDDKPKP